MLSPALANPIRKPESSCVPGNQTRESLAWESQEELNSREKWDSSGIHCQCIFSLRRLQLDWYGRSSNTPLSALLSHRWDLFLLNTAGARACPSIPINSYFLRSWDQLTKALPSFRGLKCALGRGGRSDGARWEKTLGSLAALWSLSRLQHSRAESRPPACDLKTSQSLQKTKIVSPVQDSSRERHTSWWD